MKKSIFLIFAIFVLAVGIELVSCTREKCGSFDVHDFYMLGFYGRVIDKSGGTVSEDDEVRLHHLILGVGIDSLRYVQNRSLKKSFDFFTTAFACSPVPAKSLNLITDIEIYSDADITDSIQAGENLVDYFLFEPANNNFFGPLDYASFIHSIDQHGQFWDQGELRLLLRDDLVNRATFIEGYKQLRVVVHLSDAAEQTIIYDRIFLSL